MTDINPILDAIDHCLGDWAVSPDAMRWTPEAQPERSTGIAPPAGATDHEWPDTSQWMTLGYTTTPIEFATFDETHVFERPPDLQPYLNAAREHVLLLAELTEIPRLYLDVWSAERPADHTDHVHFDAHPESDDAAT